MTSIRNTITMYRYGRCRWRTLFIACIMVLITGSMFLLATDYEYIFMVSASISTSSICQNDKPVLLLFTTFKDVPDRLLVNNNTLHNWLKLGPCVRPLLFCTEDQLNTSLTSYARSLGWFVLPAKSTKNNIPILREMFKDSIRSINRDVDFIGYANSDILFTQTLVESLLFLRNTSFDSRSVTKKPLLVIGQRRTTLIKDLSTSISGIRSLDVLDELATHQNFDGYNAIDYFIYKHPNKVPWDKIPDFVVGLPGYDNWLPAEASVWGVEAVDVTQSVNVLHQLSDRSNPDGGWLSPIVCMNRDLVDPYNYNPGRTSCAPYIIQRNPPLSSTNKEERRKSSFPEGKANYFGIRPVEPELVLYRRSVSVLNDNRCIVDRNERKYNTTCEQVARIKRTERTIKDLIVSTNNRD